MRCATCAGPLLHDRLDDEWRCLLCGRVARRGGARRAEVVRTREPYPRRVRVAPEELLIDCWG